MRQLNIAQRSANVFASVRNCAFVAGNEVRLLLLHLLHALPGTSSSIQRDKRQDWILRGMSWYGMSPVMIPVTKPTSLQTAIKRRS
jgi:hypothetical protein